MSQIVEPVGISGQEGSGPLGRRLPVSSLSGWSWALSPPAGRQSASPMGLQPRKFLLDREVVNVS